MYKKILSIFCIILFTAGCTPGFSFNGQGRAMQPVAGGVYLNVPHAAASSDDIPAPPPADPDEPDVGSTIAPIKMGQTAPFSGVLFSSKATAEVIAELKNKEEECKLLVGKKVAECEVNAKLELQKLQAELDAQKKSSGLKIKNRDDTIAFMDKRLEKLNDPNTELWFAVGAGGGFILGAVLTVVIAHAVTETVK